MNHKLQSMASIDMIQRWLEDYFANNKDKIKPSETELFLHSLLMRDNLSIDNLFIIDFFRQGDFSLISLLPCQGIVHFFRNDNFCNIKFNLSNQSLTRIKSDLFNSTFSYLMGSTNENLDWRYIRRLIKFIYDEKSFARVKDFIANTHFASSKGNLLVLYQFLGSYDPYHLGHRMMVQQTLQTLNNECNHACVSLMKSNNNKPSIKSNYEYRYTEAYYKFHSSILIDSFFATLINLPSGHGMSTNTLFHAHLIAYVAGSNKVNIVIGSDKFMSDFNKSEKLRKNGSAAGLQKFCFAYFVFYIIIRKEDFAVDIEKNVQMANENYLAKFVVIGRQCYSGEPISSSKIKSFYNSSNGNLIEKAKHMEYGDCLKGV